VLMLAKTYAGFGPEAVNDWLEQHQQAGPW
jgi:hypothetical protein